MQHRSWLALVSLLSVAAAGCKDRPRSGQQAGSTTEPAGHSPEASCEAQVSALREWMKLVAADSTPLDVAKIPLLSAAGSSPRTGGVVLAFEPDRVWLDGSVVAEGVAIDSPEGLARLSANARLAAEIARGGPIYLAVSPSVTWNSLTSVLAGAGIERCKLGFLFDKKPLAAPPEPSPLSAKLEGKRTLRETAPAISKALGSCGAFAETLKDLAQAGAVSSLPELLAEGFAEATLSCDCSVGTDIVATAYWSMVLGGDPTYSVATVSLVSGEVPENPSTAVLAYPDDARWQDVAPRIREIAASGSPRVEFATLKTESAPPMAKKRSKGPSN